MTKVKAILFDLDGTLLNTFEHIVQAFEKVLPLHGIEPDRAVIRTVIGKTLVDCYKALSPAIDVQKAAAQHHEIQQTPEMYSLIVAYDSLRETLDVLEEKGIQRAVVTNRGKRSVQMIFDHAGITKDFDTIVTPDDLAKPKPDPEGLIVAMERMHAAADDILMVGDTAIDIETGKNAGVLATVGVTHGFGTRAELEAAGADYIIDSLGELLAVIKKIEQ